MSLSIEQMRNKISDQYENPKWKDRVAGMKASQVFAIYHRMDAAGKFGNPPAYTGTVGYNEYKQMLECKRALHKGEGKGYRQMTIFDYI